MTTYTAEIKEIDKRLAEIDYVLEVGDVNEDMFKELTKLYTNGTILKAMLRSTQTLRERKNAYQNSYKNKEADNDKQ